MRAMDNLGAVIGIAICIVFFKFLGYKKLLFLAAIPSLIGALLILVKIKETGISDTKIYKGLSLKDFNQDFKLYLLLSAFFAIGSFSYSFLLIFAKQFGFRITFVPVLYLIFTATASAFSLPFGMLADKAGRKFVLILSFLFWALVCTSLIFIHHYLAIVLSFVLYGLHKGALEPVQQTLVSELAPTHYRASSLGAFQMVIGLCAFPASLMAGLLWDKINILAPFYLSLGFTILATIMLLFVNEIRTV